MNWFTIINTVLRVRRGIYGIATLAAFSATIPHQAFAAQVQAYVLFELADFSGASVATEKLRSTSLGNCLQLIIGHHQQDVFIHLACDDSGGSDDTSNLNRAMVDLSDVEGVARATIVSLKRGSD
jgi:hypothetical protein